MRRLPLGASTGIDAGCWVPDSPLPSLLAAGLGWHLLQPPTHPAVASAARTGWKPADPRLAGAAIELDAARMELQLAIQQAPDSAALQRLLSRTELQQTQLRRLASHQAG